MARPHISPNQREILYVTDSATGGATYVTATNNKLDVNATASLAGSAIPISGATTAVGVAIVDGSGNQITSFGGGTQYANGAAQATPTGTVALGWDTANVRALSTDASGKLNVNANAGTNLNTSLLALESGGNLATLAGGVTSSVYQNNTKQINGVTPLMGNGVTGTGSQRVTIASDNTAFSVNATLSAETTKVIGTTRSADGAGNLLTSNSTTYTAKFGLDNNLLGTLGTAFSTAGKVDVKGADGDVFVRQATGSNLHTVVDSGTLTAVTAITNALPAGANVIGKVSIDQTTPGTTNLVALAANQSVNVAQVNGGTTSTVATGVQKVATADSAGTAFLSAANALNSTGAGIQAAQVVAQFDDTSPTSITENQFGNLRMSVNRNLYDTIRDAAGNERGVNVTAGNALQADATSVAGTATAVNNGTSSAGTQRVTLASDSTGNIATIGTSITPGTGATNLGKAEDAAAVSGDTIVAIGGVRNDTLADKTNTDGDYSIPSTDIKGRVITAGSPRGLKTNQQTTITSSTTETTVLTAVASTFLDVYGVIVTNTSATVTKVTFKDDTAGTTRFVIEVPATDTRGFMLPIDAAHNQAIVNKPWTATCGTSVASVEITVLAVKMV